MSVIGYEVFQKLKDYQKDIKWMEKEDKERFKDCIELEGKLYKQLVEDCG